MKFNLTLYLFVCMFATANASDLSCLVKSTIKGGNTGAIDLSISGGVSPYQVSWTGPNGFSAVTEDLVNLGAGTYTVTVTDAYCGTVTTTIIVTDFLTAIDELVAAQISIFPNPATTEAEIRLPEFFNNYIFRMMNTWGELVIEKKNASLSSFTIDLKNVTTGMYIIEIIQDDRIYRKKVMKD
jgi:hypothetical protein